MSGLPNIGFPELLLILGVVLLIFGPRRLVGLGSDLGQAIRGFQRALKGLDNEVRSTVDDASDASEERTSPKEARERKAD